MNPIINGVPLTALVIALVEWVKRFGVEGKTINAVSLIIGAIVGVAYWYAQSSLVTFTDWFNALLYGLTLGLTASGLYDANQSAVRG